MLLFGVRMYLHFNQSRHVPETTRKNCDRASAIGPAMEAARCLVFLLGSGWAVCYRPPCDLRCLTLGFRSTLSNAVG